jgi:hypothetical protein
MAAETKAKKMWRAHQVPVRPKKLQYGRDAQDRNGNIYKPVE